jgi:hypothetical protein
VHVTSLTARFNDWARAYRPRQVLAVPGTPDPASRSPFSPLGKGFLTGTVTPDATFAADEIRSRVPRFEAENLRANQAIVDRVRALAADQGATPAQVALAWLLAQQPFIVPSRVPAVANVRTRTPARPPLPCRPMTLPTSTCWSTGSAWPATATTMRAWRPWDSDPHESGERRQRPGQPHRTLLIERV